MWVWIAGMMEFEGSRVLREGLEGFYSAFLWGWVMLDEGRTESSCDVDYRASYVGY